MGAQEGHAHAKWRSTTDLHHHNNHNLGKPDAHPGSSRRWHRRRTTTSMIVGNADPEPSPTFPALCLRVQCTACVVVCMCACRLVLCCIIVCQTLNLSNALIIVWRCFATRYMVSCSTVQHQGMLQVLVLTMVHYAPC